MSILQNTKAYIEKFLKIRTKKGDVVPLVLNKAQTRLYDEVKRQYLLQIPIRIIVLKARQLGISTVIEAIIFKKSATKENVNSLITAHLEEATANLFRMNKLFYNNLPAPIKPMTANSNAQEIYFANPDKNPERRARYPGLNSKIRCNTAGGDGVGRSETFTNVHASEFGFWRGKPLDTWTGIIQAVPSLPETMVFIESTANGFNEFKELWDAAVAGENEYTPLFFAWYDEPEYAKAVPPGTEWTLDELEMSCRYQLTAEQLQWRRWCIRNNCMGDEKKFRQEYPSNPDEAFLTSGRGVFDNEVVMLMRERAPKPLSIGEFDYDYDEKTITNIRWVDKPDGCIQIYAKPNKRKPYVLGGDTAGEGSDWFTGHVIDNISGKQVAVLHRQYDESAYARQIYCLGMHYNEALVGIETNYSTFPVMELTRLRYPNQYVREKTDTYTGQLKKSFGFSTDQVTRPTMIANLQEMFQQHPELFTDYDTLGEMLTFVKNEKDRPEALSGKHDDLVMGLAITYAIRNQQRFTKTDEIEFTMNDWPKDVIEDYWKSNETERARIRSVYCKKKEADDE